MEETVFERSAKLPKGVEMFDEFGFAVFQEGCLGRDERHHVYRKRELTDRQMAAWQHMLSHWSHTQLHAPERLRAYLKKGIPCELRPQLWRNILGCQQLQQASTFDYMTHVDVLRKQLVDLQISEYTLKDAHHEMWSENANTSDEETLPGRQTLALRTLRQIIVDVDRTFATHRLFMTDSSESIEGKASLFRVLCIYALYNPEVGYCQGMSYLAGMLLMHMKDEEEAFWAMVALFEKPKYLAGYFDDSLSKIQEHAHVFQKILHQKMRNLDKHLTSYDLDPLVFVTPWFMCLYTSFPCWDTVLAIWDLILLDGISTIFRVALSVLSLCRAELMECNSVSLIMPRLLHPPLSCMHFDTLMPVVWKTRVEKWEITALQGVVLEEKMKKKQGVKRGHNTGLIMTRSHHQSIKRTRLGSDNNNNAADEIDSSSGNTESIFKRVVNMFYPLGQRALQDTTNQPEHSESLRSSKVNDESKVKYNATPNGSRLRSRYPGGAKTCTPAGRRRTRTRSSSKPPTNNDIVADDNVWSSVGDRYSPSQLGVIGHQLDPTQRVLIHDEPVVRFSVNGPKRSLLGVEDRDRVSPCDIAQENSFMEPKLLSPLVTIEKEATSVQGQRLPNDRSSSQSQRSTQQSALQSPNVASIYFRRNPLNVPTNRRLIGGSARLLHSFKTFHTPTPLRRSQRLRLSSSPCPSSPEVELQFFGGGSSGKSWIRTPSD